MPQMASQALSPLSYDPLDLEEDPYLTYRRLRDEAPVYQGHSAAGEFWALSRFDDVQAAARDWETFSSAQGNDLDDTPQLFAPAGDIGSADPPLHTRLRDAVKKEFGLSAIRENLEPLVHQRVRQLIGEITRSDAADFARDLAYPLPASLVCGWLGFPREDHDQLARWHSMMLERNPMQDTLPARALKARDEMRTYVRAAMLERMSHRSNDLLSTLVDARQAGKLSEDEVLGSALLLFDAGVSTTSALISSSLLHLRRFEDQRQLIRRSPEKIPAAVEELMRFDAPFQWFTRVATREVTVRDVQIPKGARVVLVWASANRDERRWDAPDELMLDREPKRHLSFGEGIHHCLGAPLARMETQILFERLMPLLEDYEVTGPVERRITPSERTIVSLPVSIRWDQARIAA